MVYNQYGYNSEKSSFFAYNIMVSYYHGIIYTIVTYNYIEKTKLSYYIFYSFIQTATNSRRPRVTAAPGPSVCSEQTSLVATLPDKWPPLGLCPTHDNKYKH